MQSPSETSRLESVLERARDLGFLGPGAVADHVHHALAMGAVLGGERSVLDLGSGGGLPGLALIQQVERLVLLDASAKRCDHLRRAVRLLDARGWVEVVQARAEEAAHDDELRGRFDAVVARSFGSPAVVAECAVGFLHPNGRLVVSEPPDAQAPDRWSGLAESGLGLALRETPTVDGFGFAVLERVGDCPPWVPRRPRSIRESPAF